MSEIIGTTDRLEQHGIRKYFDVVVASAEAGVAKPDKRIFETGQFDGELVSSEEGAMHWGKVEELSKVNLVENFHDLLDVILFRC